MENPGRNPIPTQNSVAPVTLGVPAAPMHPVSLYVGDLHPAVTEAILFEKFSRMGQVLSIRVCRDAITRNSLGYAYVNFNLAEDAKNAMRHLNFTPVMGRQIRIMLSNRDPSVRRSGTGNVFIKNLDKSIDTKAIYDTFSMFGDILSCKVVCDPEGNSKGYGFIHFASQAAAQKAIDKVNGMHLEGKNVFVGEFHPRSQRPYNGQATCMFVKNFGDLLDTDKLKVMFTKFGKIKSAVAMRDNETGKLRGFGFVDFENQEDAVKSIEAMNGYVLPDSDPPLKLTVCPHKTNAQRLAEKKLFYDQRRLERISHYTGVNLYIKNISDEMDSEALHKLFATYGKIISAKVTCDADGRTRGFGFVCFENAEDASKAISEMNGKIVGGKPLYVGKAQLKEDRRAQQAAIHYMQRLSLVRMPTTFHPMQPTMQMPYPPSGGFFPTTFRAPTPFRPHWQPKGNPANSGIKTQ